MAVLGVQTDYIEYMMGHKVNTYHDVKMIGIENSRYTLAQDFNQAEGTKRQARDAEGVHAFARLGSGEDHRQGCPCRTSSRHSDRNDDERAQFAALGEALKEWIKREASNAHSEQEKQYTSQK
jgi:hypothetical protein